MKLLSWDQQLGLASPLPYAANQSGKTKIPSKNETGLDASRHTRVSAEGAEKTFLLDILSPKTLSSVNRRDLESKFGGSFSE